MIADWHRHVIDSLQVSQSAWSQWWSDLRRYRSFAAQVPHMRIRDVMERFSTSARILLSSDPVRFWALLKEEVSRAYFTLCPTADHLPRLAEAYLLAALFQHVSLFLGARLAAFCRISSATPFLGTWFGTALFVLSALNANVVFSVFLHKSSKAVDAEGLSNSYLHASLFDTILVSLATLFVAQGAKFKLSKFLPSDLFKEGAFGRREWSVPTSVGNGHNFLSGKTRVFLQTILHRRGCHHCGKKGGRLIGDHIPPRSIARGRPMRFYPQCNSCRQLQATACSTRTRTLLPPGLSRIRARHLFVPACVVASTLTTVLNRY
ncbi:MAG: hypothetical protein MHM6MM_001077 [Cercozoa sp. M6MM]